MGVIFPLSVWGKIVLVLLAIVLGLIWSMMMWPLTWRKWLRKDAPKTETQETTKEKPKK